MMSHGTDPSIANTAQTPFTEPFSYLKQVSRVKHQILGKYLGAWSGILGTKFRHLAYFDCFAGDGRYVDEHGLELPGSPQHALRIASDFVSRSQGRSLTLGFIERNAAKAARLLDMLNSSPKPNSVFVKVFASDARDLSDQMIGAIATRGLVVPTFFFVDPYGYPLPVPILHRLLAIPKAELLVNLMWYRISMDLGNPAAWDRIDALFAHDEWPLFDGKSGTARECAFMDYFEKEVGATYHVRFPMTYSPEDRVSSPENRHKYFLVHFSSHHAAPLAMKDVMYRARNVLETIHAPTDQLPLFEIEGRSRRLDELKAELRGFSAGQQMTFLDLRIRTANLPFAEPEYRQVVKELDQEGRLRIERRESKRTGLADGDLIRFG
jgi:three-Cys-motif partner protein